MFKPIFKFLPIYILKRGIFLILLSLFLSQHPIWSRLDLDTINYLSDDDYRAEMFLKETAQKISAAAIAKFGAQKPVFITVNHIVPTILPYLSALSSIGDIAMIIPKGKSPDPQVHRDLQAAYGDNYRLQQNTDNTYSLTMTRTMLGSPEKVLQILNDVQQRYRGRPIIIIDIGGYFVNTLKIPPSAFGSNQINLVGIVEDTENGHQKYEQANKDRKNGIPLYSVARSELKKTEDYCVGKSIVEATDTLFRIKKHTISERIQTVGVMGYGKIGSSIAEHLRRKNMHVFVSEVIPLRAQLALSNDHNVVFDSEHPEVGYKKLFQKTNIIFGATGQKALKIADLKEWLVYQDVIYLSSCTSAVDEYDFDPLCLNFDDSDFECYRKDDQVLEFTTVAADGKTKKVVFFRGGDAVNFCFGGVNGPYIYSVQAALLTAASKLFNHPLQQALIAVAPIPVARRLLPQRGRADYPGTIKIGHDDRLSSSRQVPTTQADAVSVFQGEIMKLQADDETDVSKTFLHFFTK